MSASARASFWLEGRQGLQLCCTSFRLSAARRCSTAPRLTQAAERRQCFWPNLAQLSPELKAGTRTDEPRCNAPGGRRNTWRGRSSDDAPAA